MASSKAVRFLLTGRTLLIASFTFSKVSESKGTSCEGRGEADDDVERADDGMSSIVRHKS